MRTRPSRVAIVTLGILACGAMSASQTAATRQLMKSKLVHAERILEALMTSNFDLLGRETEALSHIPEQPGWRVLTTPEYSRYSSAFLNATNDLAAAARDHDLDAVAVHYTAMTMTCYECHRYLKNARIADLDPIGELDAIGDGDGQKPAARQPPPKPAPPARAVPRQPSPQSRVAPSVPQRAEPRSAPRVQVYPYPLLLEPDLLYRFPYGLYPYYRWGYPYPPYAYPIPPADWVTASPEAYGSVLFDVTPKDASVVVDGFYTGSIEDLEGARLDLTPGPHHIELQARGFQTVTLDVNVQPDRTIKYRAALQPVGNGS